MAPFEPDLHSVGKTAICARFAMHANSQTTRHGIFALQLNVIAPSMDRGDCCKAQSEHAERTRSCIRDTTGRTLSAAGQRSPPFSFRPRRLLVGDYCPESELGSTSLPRPIPIVP